MNRCILITWYSHKLFNIFLNSKLFNILLNFFQIIKLQLQNRHRLLILSLESLNLFQDRRCFLASLKNFINLGHQAPNDFISLLNQIPRTHNLKLILCGFKQKIIRDILGTKHRRFEKLFIGFAGLEPVKKVIFLFEKA